MHAILDYVIANPKNFLIIVGVSTVAIIALTWVIKAIINIKR